MTPDRTLRRRPGLLLRAVFRAPLRLCDWHAGWLLGHRFLRLTDIGRCYQTVVEVVHTDPSSGEVMVMAGFGRTTDWLRNIQAQPAVEITIGRDRFAPTYRILDKPDAAVVLAGYEHRNRLITPIPAAFSAAWSAGHSWINPRPHSGQHLHPHRGPVPRKPRRLI